MDNWEDRKDEFPPGWIHLVDEEGDDVSHLFRSNVQLARIHTFERAEERIRELEHSEQKVWLLTFKMVSKFDELKADLRMLIYFNVLLTCLAVLLFLKASFVVG